MSTRQRPRRICPSFLNKASRTVYQSQLYYTLCTISLQIHLVSDLLFAFVWDLELHAPQSRLDITRSFSNFCPVRTLRNRLLAFVMESHHRLHHPLCLPYWTE